MCAVATPRLDRQSIGAHVRGHGGQIVFRQREERSDRLHLRDDNEAVRISGVDHVPRIDVANPDTTGYWRLDVAVADVQFCVLDLRFIGENGSFVDSDRGFLSVVLLLRDDATFGETGVAKQIAPSVLQLCRVFEAIGLSLCQR